MNAKNEMHKNLFQQIDMVLSDSTYVLTRKEIHPAFFGNVIIEITNGVKDLQFVCDRGDIYLYKKNSNSAAWSDAELKFIHSENVTGNYNNLIIAIKQEISK